MKEQIKEQINEQINQIDNIHVLEFILTIIEESVSDLEAYSYKE